mgnify:CR=1 FL=1
MKITVKFEPKDLPPFEVDTVIEEGFDPDSLARLVAGALHDSAFEFYFAMAKRNGTPTDADAELMLREKTYQDVDSAFRSIIQE